MVTAARWLRAGLEIALVTTAAVLVVYHSKGGCRLARRSRYNDEIMTYSNMLCCPTPYAISASGYSLASLAGVVGLAATERGHGVSAAATEALGSVCCCCRLRRDAGPVAVAFAGLMLFGLAVLSLFKAGGCNYDPQRIKPPEGYKGSDEIELDKVKEPTKEPTVEATPVANEAV